MLRSYPTACHHKSDICCGRTHPSTLVELTGESWLKHRHIFFLKSPQQEDCTSEATFSGPSSLMFTDSKTQLQRASCAEPAMTNCSSLKRIPSQHSIPSHQASSSCKEKLPNLGLFIYVTYLHPKCRVLELGACPTVFRSTGNPTKGNPWKQSHPNSFWYPTKPGQMYWSAESVSKSTTINSSFLVIIKGVELGPCWEL